jgi:hypothetical protein
MLLDASDATMAISNSIINAIADASDQYVIKIFDVNGKRAKTIVSNSIISLQDLTTKTLDLASGAYIANAFTKGVFVRSFKFLKE